MISKATKLATASIYFVAVDVEFLPGHTTKGIRLSPAYTTLAAAYVVQAHVRETQPDAYVSGKVFHSNETEELFYKLAQDADDAIRERYSDEIAFLSVTAGEKVLENDLRAWAWKLTDAAVETDALA